MNHTKHQVNSSDAYTAEIRAYDKSMLGLYGIYTPIGPEVGVNRSMVINPKIKTTRGLIQNFDIDKANSTNLFSVGELLNTFTPGHADSPRTIMATVQGKHITPTHVQHPYLVGNGVDKALAHMVGNDFSYSCLDDGVIDTIDTKTEIATIKYKDGSMSIVNLAGIAAKNSGGGFFIENRLTLRDGYKVGTKVKKGEIIAIDKSFFKEMLDGSIGFAGGRLAKVAIIGLSETFEDSSVVTQAIVNDLSSDIINERRVVLSKNSRITKIAKIGDHVEVNDSLVIFEEVGDNDDLTLKALEKLDTNTSATIEELARSTAKAKFSGEVFDIQIFYNTDPENLHPSLRKIVNEYVKKYSAKAKYIDKGRDDEFVHQPSVSQLTSEKILGDDVDGVVIQFFIKHVDKFSIGNKCTFSVAAKTICAETIEEGLEPYSEYDILPPTGNNEREEVSALLSPLSLVARMIPDMQLMGFSQKVLLGLEKQCIELLES